jgi:hypothetical protein
MSEMQIAILGVGVGVVTVLVVIFLSTVMSTASKIVKRMRVAGRDLCAVCGTQIPRNAIYCEEHKHLAALRARRGREPLS